MPIIKSAQKRARSAKKATVRNLKTKRTFKVAIKAVQSKLKSGSKTVSNELAEAQSSLDKAVKKGIIHKNKAARKKAQLAAAAKKSGAKVSGVSKKPVSAKPAKKTAVKKTSLKKKPAKKSNSKK
jgi:small subunit ribosomal protein S20